MKKLNRLGEKHITKEGYEIEIIEYFNKGNCGVKFNDGLVLSNIEYVQIQRGTLGNPNYKSICNVGYIGVGNKKSVENKKITKEYSLWHNMLKRCYSGEYHSEKPTYKSCLVHPDWHNFQNFAKWFDKNYIEGFCLDKDILVKGNKVYSPDTCCFVPNEINSLFTKSQNKRGNYLIGVCEVRTGKLTSQLSDGNGGKKHLGTFSSEEEAFKAYKQGKELYIKEVAQKWKNKINTDVYDALINYQVETSD